MAPPTKKQKTTASQPESPSADEATVAAGPENEITKEQINQMLRNLRNSATVDQAMAAMKALRMKLKNDTDERSRLAAKLIVELEGVGTIYSALRDWYEQSEEFLQVAFGTLADLTYFVRETRITLVRIGAIKMILNIAKKRGNNGRSARLNAIVSLLCNISATDDREMEEEVACDACTNLVLETMKEYAQDANIQGAGCDYFVNISSVDNIQTKLRRKGICVVLGNAIDRFVDSNDDEKRDACKYAKMALDRYSAN